MIYSRTARKPFIFNPSSARRHRKSN